MLNISVIIPVYKADKFLEKAVLSALQFDEVKEVLLIEDGSPDNSLEICKNLENKYSKIKVLQHEDKANHGAGATRNLGLENATQDFVAFLDADDYYLPNRFDAEKTVFQDSKIKGTFGAIGTEFLSEKGKSEYKEKFSSELITVQYHAEGKEVFEGLIGFSEKQFGVFFHLNTLTIRRSTIVTQQLYFNEKLRVHQDSDYIVKLSYHCHLKSGIIDKAVAIRGIHDDNRITKIKRFSSDFNNKQFLLRTSLYNWAKQQKLEKSYKEKFELYYLCFKIASSSGLKKYINFALALVQNFKILKTKYRFYYLK